MTMLKKTTLAAAFLAGSTLSPIPLLAQDASGNQKLIPPAQTQQDSEPKQGSASTDGNAQMKQQPGSADAGAKADAQIKPQGDQPSSNTASGSDAKPSRDQAQSDQMKKPGSADSKSDTTADQSDPKMKPNGDTAATQKQQSDGQQDQNTAASQNKQPTGQDQQSAQGAGQTGTSDMNKTNSAQSTTTQTKQQNNADAASANRPSNEITGSINISTEQKTEIRNVIVENKVETVKPTFSVSVGVAVPKTVKLHRLPPKVVEIVPQYKSYEYFVLADNRIVIVEPSTYEIVYILVV